MGGFPSASQDSSVERPLTTWPAVGSRRITGGSAFNTQSLITFSFQFNLSLTLPQARSQRGGFGGWNPPPEKSAQKILGLPFCWKVEHVQPENVVLTQFTSIVFQNASKCTISKEKIQKFFWGGAPQTPPPSAPPFLEPPPNHISGYGPVTSGLKYPKSVKSEVGLLNIQCNP